jgi:exonuclease III
MKILFWNIRGLGARGRQKQLKDLISFHRVDAVCLQETIKADFSVGELNYLSEGVSFEWAWTAASGHSGGTLVGVDTSVAEVLHKDCEEFFSSLKNISRADKFVWEIVNIYGPVQVERKNAFLMELSQKVEKYELAIHFGGGGRFQYEKILMGKSSNNINHTWMDVQLFYYGSWLDGAV